MSRHKFIASPRGKYIHIIKETFMGTVTCLCGQIINIIENRKTYKSLKEFDKDVITFPILEDKPIMCPKCQTRLVNIYFEMKTLMGV